MQQLVSKKGCTQAYFWGWAGLFSRVVHYREIMVYDFACVLSVLFDHFKISRGLHYALKKKWHHPSVHIFERAFTAQLCHKSEGFLQRVLGLYTNKFPKCYAALMDLPECHACLPELHLWIPEFCTKRLWWTWFPQMCINFIDTYGTRQKKWRRHSERFSEMRLRRSSRRKLEGFFHKLEGFFQESKVSSEEAEGFLPKKRKASSKERWVWTHIRFRNAVQLHLRIFRCCVCIFRSCVCVFRAVLITEKQNSNGKVSANVRHF